MGDLPGLPIDFNPALAVSLGSGGRLAVSVLPFGVAGASDLAIVLAPTPGLQPPRPRT